MALLLSEIEWGASLLPAVADPAWEAEMRKRGGQANNVDLRTAPLPWLREFCFASRMYHQNVTAMPERLFPIAAMVVAQENSCRYCYGLNRAILKIQGHSEAFIDSVERELHVAELDARERAALGFCRNLARSRPRPVRAERDALVELGYAPLVVTELAAGTALACFYNRVITMMAVPPQDDFERASSGPRRILRGLAMKFHQAVGAGRGPGGKIAPANASILADGPFGTVVATLEGLPAGTMVRAALDGAFAPSGLTQPAKALIFAVVARSMGCRRSEAEARRLLMTEGMDEAEFETALARLQSKRLASGEAGLLPWARDTVSYKTPTLQALTRSLGREVGDATILEAIGVAALANCVVRLAMLLD